MTDRVTGRPERPVDPDWLALREPADARSRELGVGVLLPALLAGLGRPDLGPGSGSREPGLRVVDLGAGTGANPRWLAPRLPDPPSQHWVLVDHDPSLSVRAPVRIDRVHADVTDLPRVLAGAATGAGRIGLVSASALLDLLDPAQLGGIVDAVVAARVPALFSLSVTGEVVLDPADPRDSLLAVAFDAHQRRGGRLGPDAGSATATLFRDRGFSVLESDTPWILHSANEADLIQAWLEGRVEAAVEQHPDLVTEAFDWLEQRRGQVAAGILSARVGHRDLLALP